MRSISRKQLHFILFVLLVNIAVTIFFSSIENPLTNTFSMTGNRYDDVNNIHFIIWAITFSFTIFYLLREIIKLHEDKPTKRIKILLHNSILLVLITLIPARLELALLRWIHIILSGVYAITLTYLIHPYVRKTFHHTVMRIPIFAWMLFIWCGAIAIYFVYGHNSIYQIWFFLNLPIFLGFTYLYQVIANSKENTGASNTWTFENRSIYIVLLLVLNIIITLIYGNIENPNLYTLSMIASLHNPIYYLLFLVWGLVYSLSTYIVMVSLYHENQCDSYKRIWILIVSVLTLLLTVLVPANPKYKILHGFHIGLSVLYVFLFSIGLHVFIHDATKGYSKIRIMYILWLVITWPGSLVVFYLYGRTGIFEMWFFVNIPLILISLVVFTNYKNKEKSKLDYD